MIQGESRVTVDPYLRGPIEKLQGPWPPVDSAARSENSRGVTSSHGQGDPLEQPLCFSAFAGALAGTAAQLSYKLEA